MKMKIYNVKFQTSFVGSPYIDVLVKALNEVDAKQIARRICRFGSIKQVDEAGRGTSFAGKKSRVSICTDENTKHLKDAEWV
tara:strand:+ start:408 stop:653 length:246 start_codon:yes stop_codon:yes gene_type:complete